MTEPRRYRHEWEHEGHTFAAIAPTLKDPTLILVDPSPLLVAFLDECWGGSTP